MNSHACARSVVGLTVSLLLIACGSDETPRRNETAPAPATPPQSTAQPSLPPQSAAQPAAQPSVQPAPAAGKVAYAGELPPLPVTNFPAVRPPEIVRAVYEFAARRPDVLRYVPCFCGCERNGHVHNEHCFVSGREADGKPRWESHGMG